MDKSYIKLINEYITAKATDQSGEIDIYGDITSDKWYDDDVTPKAIKDALSEMGDIKVLDIHINSYGGEVFAGNAIFNIIRNYALKNKIVVNSHIDGIAASMASGIAMVGEKIYMPKNAMMMIHRPISMACGNADDLLKTADILDKVEDSLIANYMLHYNGTEEELKQLLSDETWLTAEDAYECGLCTDIGGSLDVVASANGFRIGNVLYNSEKATDTINKLLNKVEIKKEEHNIMYDNELSKYGINEETFNSIGVSSNVLLETAKTVKDYVVAHAETPETTFITKDMVLDFGDDITAEKIIEYAKNGIKDHSDDSIKAGKYQKLFSDCVDEAIKNGIRAKGETFDSARWTKILNNLDYEDVLAQSKEWNGEAKEALNAGKHVSEPWNGNNLNFVSKNINDYKM